VGYRPEAVFHSREGGGELLRKASAEALARDPKTMSDKELKVDRLLGQEKIEGHNKHNRAHRIDSWKGYINLLDTETRRREIARTLEGESKNVRDKDGFTEIYHAINKHDVQKVKDLLQDPSVDLTGGK
jgi:hypothetical protein